MKRILFLTCGFLCIGILLAAQTKPAINESMKAIPTAPSPVIPDTLKARFWKAQSEFQAAQSAAEKADQAMQQKQAVLQSTVGDLKNICGKDFQPQLDASGEVACVVKK
jgi:Skp family chaperone for outer membrane proteins